MDPDTTTTQKAPTKEHASYDTDKGSWLCRLVVVVETHSVGAVWLGS